MQQMIYPKQPKILIDPATGQQVPMTPKHGLFFIPAKAWTWILGILAVPMMLLGAGGESGEAKAAATPGYKEFEAAGNQFLWQCVAGQERRGTSPGAGGWFGFVLTGSVGAVGGILVGKWSIFSRCLNHRAAPP